MANKKILITLFLFGFLIAGKSSAMNETPPPQSNSDKTSTKQEDMDARNMHICPEQIDYEDLKNAYGKKKLTSYGAEFSLPNLTVQISSNSIKLLNNVFVKYEDQVKTNSNAQIKFLRGELQRGRCTYSIFLYDSINKTKKPQSLGAFGVSMIGISEKEKQFQKYLLMREALRNKDAADEIAKTLHETTYNSVLDATLEYTDPHTMQMSSFKIGTRVKNDVIYLSGKEFLGLHYLVITTDPRAFFAINNKGVLVMLIAPWSLINENLADTAAPFQPIMSEWNKENAPIGIFWREGGDADKSQYVYQIKLSRDAISAATLYDIVKSAARTSKAANMNSYPSVQVYWPHAFIKFANLK